MVNQSNIQEHTERHRFIVGIDFGTTFSGAAYCHTSKPFLEEIEVITKWPGQSNQTDEKAPTEICYSDGRHEPLWGYEATSMAASGSGAVRGGSPIYSRFKLLLDPKTGDTKENYKHKGQATDAGNQAARIALPNGKSALDVAADYLKPFYEHVLSMLEKKVPETFYSTPIEFIITVPAIWEHKAQEATKAAVKKAGFGSRPGDSIKMISEPEAAALYALKEIYGSEGALKAMEVGEEFVIVDAGGGTVDLITYEVVATNPTLKLKESVVGGGDKCGSSYIDENFHKLLRERIGPSFDNTKIWTPKKKGRGSNLAQRFDALKRSFGSSPINKWVIELPVDVDDDDDNNIFDGELHLTSADMASLFDPVVDDVLKLVNKQVTDSKKQKRNSKLKTIVLVGGFGQSHYLYQRLKEWGSTQSPSLSVINPEKSWSAIVRGAVLQGLNPTVGSRKLRSHYGLRLGTAFEPGKHSEDESYIDPFYGKRFREGLAWLAPLGLDVTEESVVKFPASITFDDENDLYNFPIHLKGCKFEDAPDYAKSYKVDELGTLLYDIVDVPKSKFRTKYVDNKMNYLCPIEIEMTLKSAEAVFTVCVDGKKYGQFSLQHDF